MHKPNYTRRRKHLQSGLERVFRSIEKGEYFLMPAPPKSSSCPLKKNEGVKNDSNDFDVIYSSTSPSYDVTSEVSDMASVTTDSYDSMLTTPKKSVVTLTSVCSGGSPMVFNGSEWKEEDTENEAIFHSASSIVSSDLDLPETPGSFVTRKVHFKESATVILGATASSSSATSLPLSIQYEDLSTSQVSCSSPFPNHTAASDNRLEYLEFLCRSQAAEISRLRDSQAKELSKLRDQLNISSNEGKLKMSAMEMAMADMLEAHRDHLADVNFTMGALEERMSLAEGQINVGVDWMENVGINHHDD